MNLFQLGDFTLSSGKRSRYIIDCNALSDADIETLAWMVHRKVQPFGSVEGIPRGGLRLAAALQKWATPGNGLHVIVDDVWTTGGSMRKAMAADAHGVKTGYVIFAREPIPRGAYTRALFTLDAPTEFPGDFPKEPTP